MVDVPAKRVVALFNASDDTVDFVRWMRDVLDVLRC
jgi:hypothetical protein